VIHYSDPEDEHIITEAEAIAWQRAAGLARGYVYESDKAALEDFMAVNWAKSEMPPHLLTYVVEEVGDLAHPDYDATIRDMLSMLAHPSPVVREGTLHGLAKLADHRHADALLAALQRHADEFYETSPGVRVVAKEMLETMGRIYRGNK